MGYGTYASIADLKGVLGITSTTDDVIMRKQLESASRSIDRWCNRRFYVTSETKYFDGAKTLWVTDLLSVTTLKTDEDGDGTFENTFDGTALTGDYIKYGGGLEDSLNIFPKTRLEIDPEGDYGSFANGVRQGVQIVGTWGYGDGISATPYIVDTTLSAAITTTSVTTCTVTSVTNLSAGNTILIDSEQMYIYSISTLTLTVERGVNGTTAATHLNAASIYIYQYPADVRQACIDLGVAIYQNRAKQGLQSERLGDYSYTIAGTSLGKGVIESMLDNSIRGYKRMRF
jgi:hypothetical protein